MKARSTGMKFVAGCAAALAILFAALPASAQNGARAAARGQTTLRPMRVFGGEAPVLPGGGSSLVRTNDGAYMSLNAFGLTPGEAVTAWWVFFNNPKKCATSPCSVADLQNPDAEPSLVYATGRIVGADGTANFGAFRALGDTSGAVSGPGLLNPFKTEVHFVLRSHGPAAIENPEMLQQQLSTFNGGCPPNTCGNVQVSIHEP